MIATRQTDQDGDDAQRLYLDFDSFFASAEQHFNPALRGKAVGVVPLDAPGTGCIAISREAKALKVPSGASVAAAREIAPDMIFVVARPDAYVRLHHRILTVVKRCVPIADVRSIDELVCHLLPSEGQDAADLARRIKAAIASAFSDVLTCSIGVARTELLAKIGAEMNKPDGFVLLRSHDLPNRIAHLSLRNLPGVSEGIERRLTAAGIGCVQSLWATERKQARAIWGNVEGERFWNELHGLHVERPPVIRRMFGHSRNLPSDWRSPEMVGECARQLALSAARRLRRTNKSASRITVSMRGGPYRRSRSNRDTTLRWSCELTIVAARSDHAFLAALSEALTRSSHEMEFTPRAVSVVLHGLLDETEIQRDLFSGSAGACSADVCSKQAEKRERLSETMDRLRAVHGPAAVNYGLRVQLPGGYLGSKIAFGRIPDLQDFSEAQTDDDATQFYSN